MGLSLFGKGATQHVCCFIFQINVNFWCEGLRRWWFFHGRQWETLAYHLPGAGNHRFVACSPEELHVLQNKEAQTHSDCAENPFPLTSARAVLETCSWPPRSILEEVLAPLTVWAICVVLTDTLTMNLCCVMHKQCEKRAHLWGCWGSLHRKRDTRPQGWDFVSSMLVTAPTWTIYYYLLN